MLAAALSCQNKYQTSLQSSGMNETLFRRVWDTAIATTRIVNLAALTPAETAAIDRAIAERIRYHGPGYNQDFPIGKESTEKIHKIVRYLLGQTDSCRELNMGWEEFKAIFLKRNPAMLKAVRAEFRSCLANLPLPKNPREELIMQTHVGNILSLIPFTEPLKGSPFWIPCNDNGVWSHKLYQVESIIEMTPRCLSNPLLAYVLTSKEADPILAFTGTPLPSGKGFSAGVREDCTPGISVGYTALFWGMDRLKEAIAAHNNIKVTGISLGGAIGYQLLRRLNEFPANKFKKFDLFRPPGLYWWNWKQRYDEGPQVNVYIQPNDAVSNTGIFPVGNRVKIYEIWRGDGQVENFVKAHARAYTGAQNTLILELDPAIENRKAARIAKTILHILFGPVVFLCATGVTIVKQLFRLLFKILSIVFP